MKIPLEWLKEYIKTDLSDEEIANKLTMAGLSIEEIKNGVMDGEVTANRSDWLSIYGVARELAALTNNKLSDLETKLATPGNDSIIKIDVDPELILRYSGHVINGIKIAESPDWLRKRLKLAGIRPINNIVDITNYVMLETGQPLHAFDVDKIMGGTLLIRRGHADEEVVTLDGISRPVTEENIVAENNGRLVDLVGIMGGALSEVSDTTQNIFLQSAVFSPSMIRRSSKLAKLSTEASYRYERGVDYANAKKHLDRASNLITQLAGGNITQEVDIYPQSFQANHIKWTPQSVTSLLGIDIDTENSIRWLSALGITTQKHDNVCESTTPPWRFDLSLPEDITEEIARFLTIDTMPRTTLPAQSANNSDTDYYFEEYLKDILSELGFTETSNYSFISNSDLKKTNLSPTNCNEVANPLSEEYCYLRPDLQIGLLKSIAINPSFDPVALFEIGHVFSRTEETIHLGIIWAGKESNKLTDIINNFMQKLGVDKLSEPPRNIANELLSAYKIRKGQAIYWEIDITELKKLAKLQSIKPKLPQLDQRYSPLSKFPSVVRDIAIVVDKSINPDDIKQAINNTADEVHNVELFDAFESPKFGPNNISLAYRIYYQSYDKTLTDEEVQVIHTQVVEQLKKKYNAIPRI